MAEQHEGFCQQSAGIASCLLHALNLVRGWGHRLLAEHMLAGLERAQRFTWQRTAAEVIDVLESLPRTRSVRTTDATAETMQPHAS